jgi:hypothetical protein
MSLEPPFFFFEVQATWSREPFEKFPKEWPHFEEKSFEIVKIFGDLGRF